MAAWIFRYLHLSAGLWLGMRLAKTWFSSAVLCMKSSSECQPWENIFLWWIRWWHFTWWRLNCDWFWLDLWLMLAWIVTDWLELGLMLAWIGTNSGFTCLWLELWLMLAWIVTNSGITCDWLWLELWPTLAWIVTDAGLNCDWCWLELWPTPNLLFCFPCR